MSKFVDINIDDDFLSRHYPEILSDVLEDTISDIEDSEIVPYFTGDTERSMRESSVVYSKTASVVNSTPYASRIYREVGRQFSRRINRNAKPQWFEDYTDDGYKNEIINKAFAEAIKRHGGA